MRRIGRVLVALGLAGALAACGDSGGSGGGGTPTPTPTPSPTPAPTPTPVPNTALSNLVSDGDLATIAGETRETFGPPGTPNTFDTDFTTLLLHYSAANQGYTTTVGARTQTFLPADVDAPRSYPGLAFYAKTAAGQFDYLLRVRPGTATSVPNYYVGAGGWIRQQDIAGNMGPSTWGDAFAYGFPTAMAAVPATGLRRYTVDALTIDNLGGPVTAGAERNLRRIGEGEIIADFAARTVSLSFTRHQSGEMESYAGGPSAVVPETFTGTGTIAADGSITGTFACISCSGGATGTPFKGALFGPAAEEIGLTYAHGNAYPLGTGTLIGQQRGLFDHDVIDTGYSSVETTLSTGSSWHFGLQDYDIRLNANIASNNRYSTTTGFYYLHAFLDTGAPVDRRDNAFSFNSTIPAESTPQYTVYGYSLAATSYGPAADQRLYVLNPTAVDPGLMLHYVRFNRFERRETTGRHTDLFFASGAAPPPASIPTSGSTHYVGVIAGQYFPIENDVSGYTINYLLGGTVDLTVDFASKTVTGSFHPNARKSSDGSMVDMGTFPIAGGTINASGVISATIPSNPNPYYPMMFATSFGGQLFGPTGGELGLKAAFRTCHFCVLGSGSDPFRDLDAFYAGGVASAR